MSSNLEIREKLKQIKSVVQLYVWKNMNADFMNRRNSLAGNKATFSTEDGLQVKFSAYRDLMEKMDYVDIEVLGQKNDKPFEFKLISCYHISKATSIYCDVMVTNGEYGISFKNVESEKRILKIKPFKNILGKKIHLFSNNAIDQILPLIDQLSEDIKTIMPDDETKVYLEQKENVSENLETQARVALEKENQENLEEELIEVCSFPDDDILEEESFKKSM